MKFVKESLIRASPERVFAFHEQPEALEQLMPPWDKSRILEHADISKLGSRTIVEVSIFGPFTTRWTAEHTAYEPPRMFEDVQVAGPFRRWRHRHFIELRNDGSILRDEIEYEPPAGRLGRLLLSWFIESRLRKLFDYR